MNDRVFFRIADHVLKVSFFSDFSLLDYLPSFKSFLVNTEDLNAVEKPIIEVVVSFDRVPFFGEDLLVHAESSEVWGDGFRFEESESFFITTMNNLLTNTRVVLVSSKDFSESTIYLSDAIEEDFLLISWALMVVFGQGVLLYKTLMIHASVVEKNNEDAYAFLGKSGTGKSTHSQLWLKYLNGFSLLNDDNPAIRVFEEEKVVIYGTPWSGKTACYRSVKVPLKGIVRLRQAEFNNFQLKEDSEAFVQLLPSCSGIRWNKELFNHMVDTVVSISNMVPVGLLDCQINKQAAELSYYGINQIENV